MDFQIFVLIWIGLALLTFFALQYITAPYGRHTNAQWRMAIDNKLGWVIMELPALLVCPIFFFQGDIDKSLVSYIFIGLWILHYFNRTLIFPFRTKTTGKKMPLFIVISGIIFNCINGYICGHYLGNIGIYYITWLYSWQFILGMFIFFLGMGINWWADTYLINLRRGKSQDYKIPQGGLFNYISCPNLFGEIIEWFGFALMTWALPIFSFWIWTFANLVPRGIAHHRWYKSYFGAEYPKNRKGVLPFLW